MSGVNKFSGEGQGKVHHVLVAEEKVSPLPKKKVVPSEKVTASEEAEKGTNILNYMEDTVHTICINDLNNFQGKSTVSTG